MEFIDDLGSLVAVQPEATVSRTVMQVEGANVVLFSFDKGQELSEHTAAVPVLVQCLEGHLKVTGGGKTVDLVPGGILHFPTRLPHAVYAAEASKMVLIMVRS
ncbi:cupin domain-containing protein [Bifidobacterium simiiventris]|nr:cupin domain-containing protein [Bifidobacterium sp. SO1]MBW3079607.1 cupin domain-containing protein [Bifidobacterium simiiventris]